MIIPNWVYAMIDENIYPKGKGQTFEHDCLLYETYGFLIPISELNAKQMQLREIQAISLSGCGFRQDAELEQAVYEYVLKPYIRTRNCDSVFMRVNSESICEVLQKQKDIDVITDNGTKNNTISIKAVRKVYERIFWEYEKNNNTHEAGWGLYSAANAHFYFMAMGQGWWQLTVFSNSELVKKLQTKGEEAERSQAQMKEMLKGLTKKQEVSNS